LSQLVPTSALDRGSDKQITDVTFAEPLFFRFSHVWMFPKLRHNKCSDKPSIQHKRMAKEPLEEDVFEDTGMKNMANLAIPVQSVKQIWVAPMVLLCPLPRFF
jgi:hypothetical protein